MSFMQEYLRDKYYKDAREISKTILPFCREKLLLVVTGVDPSCSPGLFQYNLGYHLSKPDSVIYFWPPIGPEKVRRHQGWLYMGFEDRNDLMLVEQELKSFRFPGHQLHVQDGHFPFTFCGVEYPPPARPAPPPRIEISIGTGPAAIAWAAAAAEAEAALSTTASKRARSPEGDSPAPNAKRMRR